MSSSDKSAAERLDLQNGVSALLATGDNLVEVAEKLLRLITDSLGWDIGTLWLRERGREGPLRAFRIHDKDPGLTERFRSASAEASFPDGIGLPGKALQDCEIVLVKDVRVDPTFIRNAAAAKDGLITGVAIPIVVRDGAIGTLELYSRSEESIEEELLATLRSIGRQLAQFIIKLRLEGALAESEGGHRAVLESVAIGVITIDETSRIVATNPALETMFGYESEDMIGRLLTDLMPEPMRPLHEAGIKRYLKTGVRHIPWEGVELPAMTKDGRELIASISFSEFQRNGRTFFTGSIHDVTARHAAEKEAERLRHRMDELISSIPGIVWEAWGDPDEPGKSIGYVSEQVESILGYTQKEWLSTPSFWLERVHPDDRKAAEENARATLEGRRSAPNLFRWITRDGRPIWVESHSVPVIRDGKPIGLRGVTLDVTERVQGEQRVHLLAEAGQILSRSLDYEETLSQIAELLVPALADWCSIDLLDEEENLQRLKVLHVDPEKVALAERLAQEYPASPESPRGARRVVQTGEPEMIEDLPEELLREASQDEEHFKLLKALGIRSYLSVPIVANDRTMGALTCVSAESGYRYDEEDLEFAMELGRRTGQAIRNAELYQSAAAASRAKDEFLATLSHELRTPMTAILGWSRLLLLDDFDPELREEAIETIASSAEAQANLIDDVLDVSRIVTGKLNLQLEPVNVAKIAREALRAISPASSARQITVHEHISDVPLTTGDEVRIRQIIWNLLSNAVKFTPKGGKIDVHLRSENSVIVLQVTDDGIGIAPDFLPRVFERFQQAEASTSRTHGGLGLGLAIVRHLTEIHGGEVSVSSAGPGKGATFTVVLPISALAFDKDVAARDFAVEHPNTGRRLPALKDAAILVVDDEKDARRLISTILKQSGASVLTAESVDQALGLVDEQTFNLIVSDIGMPHRDGYELIRHIRSSSREEVRSLPVIAITAYGREEDRARVLAAGFDSYLRKPANPVDLAIEVARLLEYARSIKR